MKIGFIVFGIHFEDVEERFDIFFPDQFEVFRKTDPQDSNDGSLFKRIRLFSLVPDEEVPHVGESLRFHHHDVPTH